MSVSTLCLVDLTSLTCIDFWTKFTHCSARPTVRLVLCSALRRHTTMWWSVFFVQALYWFLKISGPVCSKDRTFVSICTHLTRQHYLSPLKMFSIKKKWLHFSALKYVMFNWRYFIMKQAMLWSIILMFLWDLQWVVEDSWVLNFYAKQNFQWFQLLKLE